MSNRLSLYYPVYPYHLNQHFGGNLPCVKNYAQPNQDIVTGADDNTCPSGYVKLYPILGFKGHNGADLLAGEQVCFASCEGTVTQISLDPHRGLGVYVTSNEEYDIGLDKPYKVSMVYWHFKEDHVKVGDTIKVGDDLGITDSTGYSSGDHLHFEMIPVITNSYGVLFTAFPANGYQGAVDPIPFLNGQYANQSFSKPKFTFTKDLHYGSWGFDVYSLQQVLKYENLFPAIPIGIYGPITRQGVYDFQILHKIDSLPNLIKLQGMNVGILTRNYLNQNYS